MRGRNNWASGLCWSGRSRPSIGFSPSSNCTSACLSWIPSEKPSRSWGRRERPQDGTRREPPLRGGPVLLRMARKQVAAAARAAGAVELDAERVELAVGEALTNAHDHGYGGVPGPIELEIAYEPHRFAVTVHDEGPGPQFPDPPDRPTGSGYG